MLNKLGIKTKYDQFVKEYNNLMQNSTITKKVSRSVSRTKEGTSRDNE